jgi:hypothetical protein
LAIGADVTTVWIAWYEAVGGCEVVTAEFVGGAWSAAPESFPAHTPAAITAASTAPAAPTGTHRATSLSGRCPPELPELEEREPDDFDPDEPDEPDDRLA